jgi:hypothetical protein
MADWQLEEEPGIDMPSLNHSLLQTRLVKLIDKRFVTLTELSLDISVVLYGFWSTEFIPPETE